MDSVEKKIQRYARSVKDRLHVLRKKLNYGARDRVKTLFDLYVSDVAGEL